MWEIVGFLNIILIIGHNSFRGDFTMYEKIFNKLKDRNLKNISIEILSMGMTNDYKIAIQEGATMIRVGSGIFGLREK